MYNKSYQSKHTLYYIIIIITVNAVYWARAATLTRALPTPEYVSTSPCNTGFWKTRDFKEDETARPHCCPRQGWKADGTVGSGVGQQQTGISAPSPRSVSPFLKPLFPHLQVMIIFTAK